MVGQSIRSGCLTQRLLVLLQHIYVEITMILETGLVALDGERPNETQAALGTGAPRRTRSLALVSARATSR